MFQQSIRVFIFSVFQSNGQINDYVAGYHDGALLFGKVLRERMLSQQRNNRSADVPLSHHPFGKVSFNGVYDRMINTVGGRIKSVS